MDAKETIDKYFQGEAIKISISKLKELLEAEIITEKVYKKLKKKRLAEKKKNFDSGLQREKAIFIFMTYKSFGTLQYMEMIYLNKDYYTFG